MSDCPYCKWPNCYNSGFTIECSNPECKCFSLKQCNEFVSDHLRKALDKTFGDGQVIDTDAQDSLKAAILDEIWRRMISVLTPGQVMLPWPAPLEVSNPAPTILAITWPQPDVDPEHRIVWRFEF